MRVSVGRKQDRHILIHTESGCFSTEASHLAVGFIIIRTLLRFFKILNARDLPRVSIDHPFYYHGGTPLALIPTPSRLRID